MRCRHLLLCLLAAACDMPSASDLLTVPAWAEALLAPGAQEAKWDDAAAGPPEGEPALSLTLGSRRGVALLIQEEGERRLWRTPGGVALQTEGARIVATAGLRQVLAATRFDGTDLLARLPELEQGEWRATRVVDLMRSASDPARMRFGLRLDCRLSIGPTEIADTLLIEERCRGGARFTSRFWADARSYAVFRSEQWVGDDLPPLVVEVVSTRAPAEIIPLPR